MRRILFGLLVTPFFLNMAWAQTADVVKQIDDQLKSLRTEDETLRQALANHPDIMVAAAKLRVAEAELAQVRLVLTQKIAGLRAEISARKDQIAAHEKQLEVMHKAGGAVSQQEIMPFQSKVTELKTGLSRIVAEYDGMTKPAALTTKFSVPLTGPKAEASFKFLPLEGQGVGSPEQGVGTFDAHWIRSLSTTPGSAADRLKSVLDKTAKYDAKETMAAKIVTDLKQKFGIEFMIRMPVLESEEHKLNPRFTQISVAGDMTFTSWVELVLDEVNAKRAVGGFHDAYLREYGLLIAPRDQAPQGALTLRQFAAQVRAEKAAKEPKQP